MQIMKWMAVLFTASALYAGSALADEPAAPVEKNTGKVAQTDHSAHVGQAANASDAVAPAAGKEEKTGYADHSSHAEHGKKCMGMDGKKCMEMGDKKCMKMGGKGCNCCKDCMQGDGKQCDHHKDQKSLHKSNDACDTRKGAASDEKKPAGGKPDTKDSAAKPSAKAAEPALSEAEGRALAQKSNCFSCHSIDKKVVGPAWKDVAAKYRGDASAEDKLIAKVSRGGFGVWGSVPMPANSPAVKDADIKALVKFLLSLK